MQVCLSLGLENVLDGDARRILEWPEELVTQIKDWMIAVHGGGGLRSEEWGALREWGLATEEEALTRLGQTVRQLLVHEDYQEGDELLELVQLGRKELEGSVLEVGCSTGRALRGLSDPRPAERVGVDIDTTALALGHRLAQAEKQNVHFRYGSAHALPFASRSFDWVICRNALTYTHQRTALREMMRVLKPGGWIYLRYENIWFDMGCMPLKSPKLLCARLKNLGLGVVHRLVGWQPVPGTALAGCRAFASAGQLRQILRSGGCEVVQAEPARRCPKFLRWANQTAMVGRKKVLSTEC